LINVEVVDENVSGKTIVVFGYRGAFVKQTDRPARR
jgi:hypothetical protein